MYKYFSLIIVFIVVFILSLNFGGSDLTIVDVWNNSELQEVFWDIRLPRVLNAVLIGCMLSVSGVAFQAVFQNPLVSPDLLGASSGAAMGTLLLLICGVTGIWLPVGALFSGGVVTVICVMLAWLINRRGKFNQLVLILTGILLSSLIVSFINILHYFMPDEGTLLGVTSFLMGSLNGLGYHDLMLQGIFGIPAIVMLFVFASRLNLLVLPVDILEIQGINTRILFVFVLLLASMAACTTVAIAGIIGWVSLIIPNLARMWVGGDHRTLLPFSALMGADFVLVADLLSRTITEMEIPIGILIGIIGAPLFLVIMAKNIKWEA